MRNEPAFPLVYDGEKAEPFCHNGLTKREYAAIQIMQGLTAKYNLKEPDDQITISKMAVELSDSLFNQLNK